MSHPYSKLPDRNFWKHTVATRSWTELFREERGRFSISPSERVATAGSCFAQRISRLLRDSGCNFAEFESAHPLMLEAEALKLGYGRFSARYGNIYTTRQLKQLVDEAFEVTAAEPKIALAKNGRFIDLRRPYINEVGFDSEEEACADRRYHLACVRRMFTESDIFVFTLGLTEAWVDELDGTVYGTHPAVAAGNDWNKPVTAVNFDYLDCYNDMVETVNFLRGVNPALRFIFTVSPVALAATHQERHVLMSTVYSKSVLRAVVGRLVEQCPFADYFFSFEIFNAAQSFGQYLSEDLRDVNSRGVALAMQTFRDMYLAPQAPKPEATELTVSPMASFSTAAPPSRNPADVECDEIMNALFSSQPSS